MMTVPEVIDTTYGPGRGSAAKCADQLGVRRSAVSMWKSCGQIPPRHLPAIIAHAKERGIELDIQQIPISQQSRNGEDA